MDMQPLSHSLIWHDAGVGSAQGMRVALFATCFNDTMWPETPKATVRLLERLGCRVEFPAAQTCCGQMLTNTGYAGQAVPHVRRFVDVFGDYDAVVAPSAAAAAPRRRRRRRLRLRAGVSAVVVAAGASASPPSSSSPCSPS